MNCIIAQRIRTSSLGRTEGGTQTQARTKSPGMPVPLAKSAGVIRDKATACLCSFPACAGQFNWNGCVEQGMHIGKGQSFACVWTGNEDSPESEWFDPWKKNVDLAVSKKQKLIFIVWAATAGLPPGKTLNRTELGHIKSKVNFYIGGGQAKELAYLMEKGYDFSIGYLP